jgi:hypothetical protein
MQNDAMRLHDDKVAELSYFLAVHDSSSIVRYGQNSRWDWRNEDTPRTPATIPARSDLRKLRGETSDKVEFHETKTEIGTNDPTLIESNDRRRSVTVPLLDADLPACEVSLDLREEP